MDLQCQVRDGLHYDDNQHTAVCYSSNNREAEICVPSLCTM